MKQLFHFLFILLTQVSYSQVQPAASKAELPEFGEIDEAFLKMKNCPIEPHASAMILFDYRKTEIDYGYNAARLITERRVRIKIFSDKGYEHANISIPYLNRKKENWIKDISAITLTLDATGKVVKEKIEKDQIFKDKKDDQIREIRFAFPNVKAGSIVEYRYTQVEMYSLAVEPWIIQDVIPVASRIFELQVPTNLNTEFRNRYNIPVEIQDYKASGRSFLSKPDRIFKFSAKNIPSFVPEPYMNSIRDNIQRVEFSFTTVIKPEKGVNIHVEDWPYFNRVLTRSPTLGLWANFEINGTAPIIDSAKRIQSDDQKIRFLFDQVRTQIKWDGSHRIMAEDLAECWTAKTGTSGEINLLLVNLLRRSGIYCLPVLISTRKNGRVNKEIISITQFNSLIVWIPGKTQPFFLDASKKHLSYKTTPFEALNRDGFAIDSGDGQWVYITDSRPLEKIAINVICALDSSDKLIGEAAVFLHDFAKERILSAKEKETDKDDEEASSTGLVISNYAEQDADDPLRPLVQKFRFKYPVTQTGELYFFNPNFLSSVKDNPFTADTRQTDVDMGSNLQVSITLIANLPDNFKAEFIPGNTLLRNGDSTIMYQRISSIEPTRIIIKSVLEIQQAIFTKEEYPALRDFYKKMYALMNEQVVLKKIN